MKIFLPTLRTMICYFLKTISDGTKKEAFKLKSHFLANTHLIIDCAYTDT